MASQRQLLADGVARRANMVRVRIDHVHVEPGFNVPETPEEWEARVGGMVGHLERGGRLPPIEVRDRDSGGVYVVEGHARVEAYRRAHAGGVPVADPDDGQIYVLTIPFTGNDADRTLRTITSALHNRVLSPLQLACQIKKLQAFGWSAADIGREIGRTAQHVGHILTLGNANTDVQQMVRAGEVSATEAVRAVRELGDGAGAALQAHLGAAKAAGKTRVTAAVVDAEKKAARARQQADTLMDAAAFRWLCENRGIVAHEVFAAMAAQVGGAV